MAWPAITAAIRMTLRLSTYSCRFAAHCSTSELRPAGADPESQYHNPAFQQGKMVLTYCASGGRSALAGKTLKEMGYGTVYNIGGFKELAEAGLETEPAAAQA